jgi:hypothetical protein
VSEGTVRSDGKIAVATHLADESVVVTARGLLIESAGRGSTEAERQAALDWLLGQTDPVALRRARRVRALTSALDWLSTAADQIESIEIENLAGPPEDLDEILREKERQLRALLARVHAGVARIEGRFA